MQPDANSAPKPLARITVPETLYLERCLHMRHRIGFDGIGITAATGQKNRQQQSETRKFLHETACN
jgi:hypothetical protein